MRSKSDANKDFIFLKADKQSGDLFHGTSFLEGCLEEYKHCGVLVKMNFNDLSSLEQKCLLVLTYFSEQQYVPGLVVIHFYQGT